MRFLSGIPFFDWTPTRIAFPHPNHVVDLFEGISIFPNFSYTYSCKGEVFCFSSSFNSGSDFFRRIFTVYLIVFLNTRVRRVPSRSNLVRLRNSSAIRRLFSSAQFWGIFVLPPYSFKSYFADFDDFEPIFSLLQKIWYKNENLFFRLWFLNPYEN